MPVDKYIYLRKAAEIEEITNRITMISDINAAFYNVKERLNHLQKIYVEIMGFEVRWEADKNWEDRLRQYQR